MVGTNKIIVFDFEVFAHDTLLGVHELTSSGQKIIQTWNLDEIRKYYKENQDMIWVGHNCQAYDNFILQAIVNGGNEEQVYAISKSIIETHETPYLKMKLYSYDLISNHFGSLKSIEAFVGKNISETQVDFNLQRKLTNEEKQLTESYNRDDLSQTTDNLFECKNEFQLRLDIINEFKLPLSCVSITGTRLAEEVLHAKKIPGIENQVVLPKMYDNLQVKNEDVKRFYLNREYAEGKKLKVQLCGVEHIVAAGGIHAARKKYHTKWAYYFDVSGYYNLIMINLNLLPRSIPDEYKKLYEYMYHEQLRLKKINPGKRTVYKTILLSVFGAMNNKYCRFYDPWQGDLVRLSGEMYLVDLLEKLEGKVSVVQSNTDGIIAELLPGHTEDELMDIINEWQTRTKFVLKLEKIYDIYQRDVNCYVYRDSENNIHTLGEAVTHYNKIDYPMWDDGFSSKEPLIICQGLVEYLMNQILPEDSVKQHKDDLRMFQYICKKLSYDWMEYQLDYSDGSVETIKLQHVNRAFALTESEHSRGMVYKYKWRNGKLSKTKVSNLPNSVFVYNDCITNEKARNEIQHKIDYQYYVDRIYERINEFITFKTIKDVTVYE